MTIGFGAHGGAEGLEFVDELKRDISSYLLKSPDSCDQEDDLLQCLAGALCYASPDDAGDDKWHNAKHASSLQEDIANAGTGGGGSFSGSSASAVPPLTAAGLKQARIFGAPPHSTSIRWPDRPQESASSVRNRLMASTGLGDNSDSGPSDSGESCDSEVGPRRGRIAPKRRVISPRAREDSRHGYALCDSGAEPLSPGLDSCPSGSQARLRTNKRRENSIVRDRSTASPMGPLHRSSSSSGLPSPELRTPVPQVNMDELLEFTSCFESSNLQYALYNIDDEAYDLVLENDVHTRGHTQWFYFAVRNGRQGQTVRLRIVNMSKAKSLFRLGMKPVVWSEVCSAEVMQATAHSDSLAADSTSAGVATALWRPCTGGVLYHRSRLGSGLSRYYTLSFEYTFERSEDCVFFAYCVPFTYSMLRKSLSAISVDPVSGPWCRSRNLCSTLGNVQCDLLEISNWTISRHHKKVVVVSSRVHPGESNASWLVHGLISFLLSSSHEAHVLRDNFVWKIVPMLNPDGVICGNYRCGLCGVDLNRQWRRPHQDLHGTVYKVKKLISSMKKKANLCMYLDLHGHSRKCGVFSYACGNFPKEDFRRYTVRMYPKLLSMLMPEFVFPHCRWRVGKGKRGTGRVVVSKDLGLTNTYTIEASFFGVAAVPGPQDEVVEQSPSRQDADGKQVEGGPTENNGAGRVPVSSCQDALGVDAANCGATSPDSEQMERAPQRIVLFTPSKLELFGANLARALLLQQNLGPAVQMLMRRTAASFHTGQETSRYWTPPGLRAPPGCHTPSESGSATASVASGGEDSEYSEAGSRREKRGTSPKSPTSPTSPPCSPTTPPCTGTSARAARREARARLKTEAADATEASELAQRQQQGKLSDSWAGMEEPSPQDPEEGNVKPYLGISVPEVLQDLQNTQSAVSTTEEERESSGSDSQPSGDNLAPQDLARLARLFTQKRKGAKRSGDGAGSRGSGHSASGTNGSSRAGGTSPHNGRSSGHGSGETSRTRAESNGGTRSRWRESKTGFRNSEHRGRRDSGQSRSQRQPPRAPDLQRTVAFGQTTYVVSSTGSPTPFSTASPGSFASTVLAAAPATSPAATPAASPLSPTRDTQHLSFFGEEKVGLAGASERERVRRLQGWSAAQWPAIASAPHRPAPGRDAPQAGFSGGSFGSSAGGGGAHSEASVLLGTPPKDRFAFPQGSFTQQGGFAQGGVFPVPGNSGSTRRSLPANGASRLPGGGRLSEDVQCLTRSRLYMRNASSTMLQWQRQYTSAPSQSSVSSALGMVNPSSASAQGGGQLRSGESASGTPSTGSTPAILTNTVSDRTQNARLLGSSSGQRPGSRPGTASARSMQRTDGGAALQTAASTPAPCAGDVTVEPFTHDAPGFSPQESDGPSSARQRPARTPSMPPAVGHEGTSTLPLLDNTLRQELMMYIRKY